MKNAFVIVTLSALMSALLSGCAGAPSAAAPVFAGPVEPVASRKPAVPPDVAAVLATGTDADEAALQARADAELPSVPLTRELLLTLMTAEFEATNGQWQGPYKTMMELARTTRDLRLARRAAELAMGANQLPESLVAVRLWRELAPGSEQAEQYHLTLAVMGDDLAEAEALLAQRLRATPAAQRGSAMLQVRQVLGRAKNQRAAAALFERLIAPYANTFEARVLLAQNAFERGDSAAALVQARAAVALNPASEIGVLTLVQVTPDQDAGRVLLENFLNTKPGAGEVRLALARVLANAGRYPDARTQFERLLAAQPDNTTALYALGVLAMQLKDNPGAEKYFVRYVNVIESNPGEERDAGRALPILAELAEERGDLKAAVRWLDQIGNDDPALYFSAQLKRAQLDVKQGDLAGGRALLASLQPEAPERQAKVLMVDAQLLREAGKFEDAYGVLAAGAARFPASAELLYDFALLAEKTGRVDVMESALRTVMTSAPDNHHAYNALGYSLAERNVRLPEALALIEKAMKMAPDDPFIMDSMGWVQYRLGNLDLAEQHLRRAYATRSDAEIGVHLGEVLWKQGKKDDARTLWRDARVRDPGNDLLRSTLTRLQPGL